MATEFEATPALKEGNLDISNGFHDPSRDEALIVIKEFEEKFPSQSVGNDRWYLVLLSSLVAGNQPAFAATLYQQLIQRPEFSTSEQRKALIRRLREALLKLCCVVGMCKPLEAVMDIDAVTAPEDRDYSFSREGWQCDEANRKRGFGWQDKLYQKNQAALDSPLAAHRDFDWIVKEISYGLLLSERSVMDDIDTELVVLGGIIVQNLPRESGWHLRGTRRIGVSKEDVETIQQCIEMVGKFCQVPLHKVPRVADIEDQV